jgi:hypothetical protein
MPLSKNFFKNKIIYIFGILRNILLLNMCKADGLFVRYVGGVALGKCFVRYVGDGPLEHVTLIFGDYNPQIRGVALGKCFVRYVGEGLLEHVTLIFGDYNPQIRGVALGKGSCIILFFF